jgi:hypothetical protein
MKLRMPTPTDILDDFYATGRPDYMTLEYRIPVEGEREESTEAWLMSNADGRVLYGHRPGARFCVPPMARRVAHGPILSRDGTAAILYMYSDRAVAQALSITRISEFGITMSGRLAWPGPVEYYAGRGIGGGWRYPLLVSSDVLVADPAVGGDAWIGNLHTGSVTSFGDLAGAAGGAEPYFQKHTVVNSKVFTSRRQFPNGRAVAIPEYWVGEGADARQIGNDLGELTTDGETMVYARDGSVYASPFATDPALLAPRLLFSNFPEYIDAHDTIMANGWVAALFHVDDIDTSLPVDDSWIVVIRIEDGAAYRMSAPSSALGRFLFTRAYPGETELWAAVEHTVAPANTNTILRIPYSSMTVIQARAPDM